MKHLILPLIITVAVLSVPGTTWTYEQPRIQVALLLDTSNSMDGLIEQAKARLWTIVNQVADTKKDGKKPLIQVALYEYGKSSLPAETGYIRMVSPLTTDLDMVSEKLFSLRTNGGSEYCGMVIERAARELGWSSNPRDLKLIFIAGNEPFTQGPVHYATGIGRARERRISVSTIFCGDYTTGVQTSWKNGALLAGGDYFNIDHNSDVVHIPAPQDDRIAQLNKKLNKTYIPFGSSGRAMKKRQEVQDKEAAALSPSVLADRTSMKSKSVYNNSRWDLADAYKSGKVDPAKIADDELPEEMKSMSSSERKKYVVRKLKDREEIQSKIKRLSSERDRYIAEKQKLTPQNKTFGQAVMRSIKKEALKKGFK